MGRWYLLPIRLERLLSIVSGIRGGGPKNAPGITVDTYSVCKFNNAYWCCIQTFGGQAQVSEGGGIALPACPNVKPRLSKGRQYGCYGMVPSSPWLNYSRYQSTVKKLWLSFDRRTKRWANITKDDIALQHSDVSAMCCTSDIIFCDICCFRSASWRMTSLKDVACKLLIFFTFLPRCIECRRGLAMRILSVRLSVCPSVRLSHACIVTKL